MATDRTNELQVIRKWAELIVTIATLTTGVVSFSAEYLAPRISPVRMNGFEMLTLLVPLGLVAGMLHGVLWSRSEKLFGWGHGAGGSGSLPSGFSAIVLSVTLTFPLALVPLLFQRFSSYQIVPPNHVQGTLALIVGGSVSHLIMYGVNPKRPGLRNLLMPLEKHVRLSRALFTECTYALFYFAFIGLTYRVMSQLVPKLPDGSDLAIVAASALAFVVGMTVFIFVRFPESLDDPTWIQVRGFFSGALLPICLAAAMLL